MQVELFAEESARAEGERQAAMISAVNLGSHGKPDQIKRMIDRLTKTAKEMKPGDSPDNPMGLDAVLKMVK